MRKDSIEKDFNFYINTYMNYCQSCRLGPKTTVAMNRFERWAKEAEALEGLAEVREQTIRHYICGLQGRGKDSFCFTEETGYA